MSSVCLLLGLLGMRTVHLPPCSQVGSSHLGSMPSLKRWKSVLGPSQLGGLMLLYRLRPPHACTSLTCLYSPPVVRAGVQPAQHLYVVVPAAPLHAYDTYSAGWLYSTTSHCSFLANLQARHWFQSFVQRRLYIIVVQAAPCMDTIHIQSLNGLRTFLFPIKQRS